MASPNQEEAVDDEMDVLRPRDADGMDELEQEEDIEGDDDETYEDGGSLSAQMHQFLTEMDLDLAQRRQTLKSLIKVKTDILATSESCTHMRTCTRIATAGHNEEHTYTSTRTQLTTNCFNGAFPDVIMPPYPLYPRVGVGGMPEEEEVCRDT